MESRSRFSHIWQEIVCHAPFTAGGAFAGIVFMLIFKNMGPATGERLFGIFHPAHVVLSAMVTTSLFALHSKKKNILSFLVVGYVGSVGIATLSDCVIPYLGEEIMGVRVPSHTALHEHGHEEGGHSEAMEGHEGHCLEAGIVHEGEDHGQADGDYDEHDEHGEKLAGHEGRDHHHGYGLHLGFIEEWYIVNPAAFLGIAIAWYLPRSRMPHAAHLLLSTWASTSHILMNTHTEITGMLLFGIFVVLFIAVWLPCCISDIVFPLLFIKGDIDVACRCGGPMHHHDHDHTVNT